MGWGIWGPPPTPLIGSRRQHIPRARARALCVMFLEVPATHPRPGAPLLGPPFEGLMGPPGHRTRSGRPSVRPCYTPSEAVLRRARVRACVFMCACKQHTTHCAPPFPYEPRMYAQGDGCTCTRAHTHTYRVACYALVHGRAPYLPI